MSLPKLISVGPHKENNVKSILGKLLWAETTTNHAADRCSKFSSWVQGGFFSLKWKIKMRCKREERNLHLMNTK